MQVRTIDPVVHRQVGHATKRGHVEEDATRHHRPGLVDAAPAAPARPPE
jgi:hypothetical protein